MSTTPELPPQVQEQLARLQQLQQTLEVVTAQKQQLEIELAESNRALDELEKVDDKAVVYKSVGGLMMKTKRKKVIEELTERKELLNTRITVLGRQEKRTRDNLKELQERLQEKLGSTRRENS
ncbi:MAG: prefoldin subunit beta [Candidatus Bathyarchaeota archaeon]|nr:MAG: prefoldin subunit beta [Candidatus Bathyarchaeota archaeon]